MKITTDLIKEQKYNVKERELYRPYQGNPIDQLQEMMFHDREPITTKEIMEQRLIASQNQDQYVVDFWLANETFTRDALLCHPNGRSKVVLDALLIPELKRKIMRATKDEEELLNYRYLLDDNEAIPLPKGVYEKSKGYEFIQKEEIQKLKKIESTNLEMIGGDPIWNILSREDKSLLRKYAQIALKSELEGHADFGKNCLGIIYPDEWGKGCFGELTSGDNAVPHVHLLSIIPFSEGSVLNAQHDWNDFEHMSDYHKEFFYLPQFIGVKRRSVE